MEKVQLYDLFRQELERQKEEEIKRVYVKMDECQQLKSTELAEPLECLTKNIK
jgi:hypothetical protein